MSFQHDVQKLIREKGMQHKACLCEPGPPPPPVSRRYEEVLLRVEMSKHDQNNWVNEFRQYDEGNHLGD